MERKLSLLIMAVFMSALFPFGLWSQSGSVSVYSGIFNRRGSINGPRLESRFDEPSGAAFDSKGNLFVVEYNGRRIRKIDKDGVVTTFAGGGSSEEGQGTAVFFNGPSDIILAEGDILFVSDQSGNKIKRVDKDGNVVTLAGSVFGFRDAQGSQAQFRSPSDLALGSDGNVYVADLGNHRIRMVDREGNVTTILGDGSTQTRLGAMDQAVVANPRFIDFDKDGNLLIASQYDLYKLDLTSKELTHLIGQGIPNRFYDGFKSEAHFNDIKDLYVNEAGVVYLGDGRTLRQYTESGYLVTVSGNSSNYSLGGNEIGNAAYVDVMGLVQKGADSLFIMDRTRHVAYLVRVENGVTTQNADITSDVTWTKEASPHVITEDITISSGAKLTIEPGAIIKRNLEAGITIKGALSAEGQEGDSIYFSDGHRGHLLVGKYFLTFEEANLSLSKLTYISAKSQSSGATPVIRVGNEVTSRTTATAPISGHLDIENSYFNQVQVLTDSRNPAASVKLKNSTLENAIFFVVGKESVEIDNALITNSELKNDERLTLSNSILEGVNVFLKNTTYNDNSVASTIIRNSIIKESGIAANELADLEISDSELLNTGIYVPSGNLKITDVKSILDRQYSSIRKPNGNFEYFSHFIMGGSAQIDGLHLNTNDKKSGIYITGQNDRNPASSLTRSTLAGDRSEALLQYSQEKDLTITATNFLSIRKMINNFSSKTINAEGNYFNGFLDSDAIEEEIYHKVDDTEKGLVIFSNPSPNRFFDGAFLPPVVSFGRMFNSRYLDQSEVRFSQVDPETEKLLVYQHFDYSPDQLTLLAEVSAPFEPIQVAFNKRFGYAVIAENGSGEQTDIEHGTNGYMNILSASSIDIDEDEELELAMIVIDDPQDSIAVTITSSENPELINADDVVINFLRKSGDSTFFKISLTPMSEAYGASRIHYEVTDGRVVQKRSFNVRVAKVNEFKPVFDQVDVITGHIEDRVFYINEFTLNPFVKVSDTDGGDLFFKITSVLNGTLKKNTNEIENIGLVPRYSNDESLSWTPPSGVSGLVDAFTLKVYDEEFDSEEEVVIQFMLEENTPPVITKLDTFEINFEDTRHRLVFDYFTNEVETTDAQGDPVFFVISELLNGVITNDYQRESGALSLPAVFSMNERRYLYWYPPADENGIIPAFKIKAADASVVSDIEHIVYFNVKPANDKPVFDFIENPPPKVAVNTLHTWPITGVSPGPMEESQTLDFRVVSSDHTKLPNHHVDVKIGENGNAELIYLPIAGVEGTVQLEVILEDNEGATSSQKMELNFLKPDSPPEIDLEEVYDVFVGNSLELVPEISDDRSVVSSRIIGDVPPWLVVDDRHRMASFTLPQHYNDDFKNGVINQSTFASTSGMVVDKRGYLIVSGYSMIRKISPDGLVTTWVGDRQQTGYVDNTGLAARFYALSTLAYDSQRDVVYALDAGNKAIRKIDANGHVSTVFKVTDNREHGYMRGLTVDKEGYIYFGTSSPSYQIFRIDTEGNVEPYAGNGDNYATSLIGNKNEVAIGETYGIHAMGNAIFFTTHSLFSRIDQNGQITQIDLPEAFTTDGYETFLFQDGAGHLLLHKRAGSQVLRFNISDQTFETMVGQGEKPFEEDVLTVDFEPQAAGSNGYRITNIVPWGPEHHIFSLSYNNFHQLTASRQKLDTIKGSPATGDIGTYEITIEASDVGGSITRKTITFNVLANNQITATNTSQQLSYTEGASIVDLDNIELSGMSDQDLARVTLTLDNKLSGRLSTSSGNGETFTESTGIWEIVSDQASVNAALAALSFEPDSDFDLPSGILVNVVNAKGGVPEKGLIELIVTPVNDPTRLVVNIEGSAFVEIPYEFQMDLEDPDTKMFNLRINSLPGWMTYKTVSWVENYAGVEQDTYWPNEGDGDLNTVLFNRPGKVIADNEGNLYVVERYRVKKITLDGEVSTYLRHQGGSYRDGTLAEAYFGTISTLIFDQDNNMIVADNGGKRIRKVSTNGVVTTLAGNGGTGFSDDDALNATFTSINGLEFDDEGNLYILDREIIRKLGTDGKIVTVAGNRSVGIGEGSALTVPFFTLRDIEMDSKGDMIIADDRTIRKWNLETNQITVLIGNGINSCCDLNGENGDVYFRDLVDIKLDDEDNLYGIANTTLFKTNFETGETRELNKRTSGERTGPLDQVTLGNPQGIESLGDNWFISDLSRNVIKRVYERPGILQGKPLASHIGDHTVAYQLINGREESVEINATITVFNNDFPRFKGIDSTYYYTEDQTLSLANFQMVDNNEDEFTIELSLRNKEAGKLVLPGFEQVFDPITHSWKLEGKKNEINEILSAMTYVPIEHSHALNIVEIRSMRSGGVFEHSGQLILRGISVNDIPVFETIPDQNMVSGAAANLELKVSDVDGDLPVIEVEGLPEFLKLDRQVTSWVSKFAGALSGNNYGAGSKDQVRLYNPNQLEVGPDGQLYLSANRYMRIITDDSLKFFTEPIAAVARNITDLIFRGQQLYIIDRTGVYTFDADGATELVAGSTQYGDEDGTALEARFSYLRSAVPGPGLRDMYLLDQNTGKIRYMDDDLNISTVFSPEDNTEVKLSNPADMVMDKNGVYQIFDRTGRILSFTHGGTLTERLLDPDSKFPSSFWTRFTGFQIDGSGNTILHSTNSIYVLDQAGNIKGLSFSFGGGTELEGAGMSVQLGYINDLLLIRDGRILYSDLSNRIVRSIDYDFEYNISGIPDDSHIGEYDVVLSANDGVQTEATKVEFKVIVDGSDKPSVTNLSQDITYTEDAEGALIQPITINSDDDSQQFEISFFQNPFTTGKLKSENADLSEITNNPGMKLSGTAAEMNEILAALTFEPRLHNTDPTSITISVKQKDGQLDTSGIISLTVIAVNDAPEIELSVNDTTAFVGTEISIPIHAYDLEGQTQYAAEHSLPEWLKYRSGIIKDELIAGIPGKQGLTNGKALESKLLQPYKVDVDSKGNIYLLEFGSYLVRKISAIGEISVFAGTGLAGYRNGAAESAQFGDLEDLIVDYHDNIYLSDPDNHVIRKISPDGEVTTFAGSPEAGYRDGATGEALFQLPGEMAFDRNRTKLFIHDQVSAKIRTIDLFSGQVSTVTFNGYIAGLLVSTNGIAISPQNELYLRNNRFLIRSGLNGEDALVINSAYGSTSDGILDQRAVNATTMAFSDLGHIVLNDNTVGGRLRFIASNQISTIIEASQDGYGTGYGSDVKLGFVSDITLMPDKSFLVADFTNNAIRKIQIFPRLLKGVPTPDDLGENKATFAIIDSDGLKAIREINIDVRAEDTLHVSGLDKSTILDEGTEAIAIPPISIEDDPTQVVELSVKVPAGLGDFGKSPGTLLPYNSGEGSWYAIASVDSLNRLLESLNFYPAEGLSQNVLTEVSLTRRGQKRSTQGFLNFIFKEANLAPTYSGETEYSIEAGETFNLKLLAADANMDSLAFYIEQLPGFVSADSVWYMQEYYSPVFSVHMDEVMASEQEISASDMILNSAGEILFVDHLKKQVRKLTKDLELITLAGSGASGAKDGSAMEAEFADPSALFYSADSSLLIADRANKNLRMLSRLGEVTTVSGNGEYGSTNGIASHISYTEPVNISGDSEGNIFLADFYAHDFRKIEPNSLTSSYAGVTGLVGFADGPLNEAIFKNPTDTYFYDGVMYLSDVTSLRMINEQNVVQTIAGGNERVYKDGELMDARFEHLSNFILLEPGVFLVSDLGANAIRQVSLKDGTVSTVALGVHGDRIGETNPAGFGVGSLVKLPNGEVVMFDTRNSRLIKLVRSTPRLLLNPLPADVGVHEVKIVISDGKGGKTQQTIRLNVIGRNTVPTVTTIADITETYAVDGTLSVPLFDYFSDAEDADNELSYEVVSNTDNTVVTSEAVDSSDGILTLNIENAGTTELEVKATDSRGASVSTTFQVEISKAAASVTITSEETIADGGEKSVMVTTDPIGLNVLVTYNGASDLPTEAGTYQVAGTIDEENYTGQATYEFVILPSNTAPTVTTIADITETYAVDGTRSVPLFDYFSDAEDADNELSYEVVSNADNTVVTSEAVDSSDGVLTLNIENAGTTELEVKATDSRGASVSTTFQVDISKASATVTITAEETIADGGEKSVMVTTDPIGLNVLVTYNGASDLPTEAGTYQVAGTIDEENYTGEATYEFIILPANTAPTVTSIANITETYAIDGTISVPLFDYFSDAEDADNELSYEVVSNADNTVVTSEVIEPADGVLTLNIENAGATELEVKATDSRGASVSTTFQVEVSKASALVTITAEETIADGGEKSVVVTTDPIGLNVLITYNGASDLPTEAGTYQVVGTIDEENYTGQATYEFVILPANIAPTVTTIADITETYVADGTISVSLFDYFSDAEDADNELSYEVVSNADNTVVTSEAVDSSDGILTLNIENAGTTELEVKATDSGGASVSTTFQVDISKASATVTITAEETIADGREKSVVVTTDPIGLNVLVTYNGASDLPTEAGTYQVAGTIDEENYTGQATYEFVILPSNTAPKITTIADITETYAVDGTLSVPLFDYFSDAEDADNELSYEVVSNTDNTVVTSKAVDSSDGVLTLNIENAGTTELEVKATDSRGASVSTTFMVTIDKAVAIVSISNNEFVNDGEQKSVTIITDPAGLTYAITYDGVETAPSDLGIYEVMVTVDDRNYSGTATGQMTIMNIAPEDLNLSGSTLFENQQGTIEIGTLTVTDQNPTDTHSYSLPVNATDNALFSLSGTALSATEAFDFETKNQYSVTVKVEDNQGASYEEVFNVSVLDVNDAPGATTHGPIEIVKDLGALSFTVSGLNTGGESAQTLVLSTTTTGVLANASVVANADGNSAVVTFESASGQEGSGSIQLTVQDDGGTENGGVDTYIVEIPVTVSPANITVTEAGNCGPGEIALSASGADGYSWYASALGGEALGGEANFTTNISASTTYYVAGTFSGDESLLRVPALASVFDLPEVPVITNNAEVLTVIEVDGAAFTWFRNGTEVPDISGASFAPTESGTYTVMITNENGCTALSAPISVIITGFEEDVPTIGVTVYPVPSSDYIHLSFAEIMRKGTQIRLLDNSGKELTSLVLEVASTKATLDVRSFASGIHFITIQEGDKLVRKRVIIEK